MAYYIILYWSIFVENGNFKHTSRFAMTHKAYSDTYTIQV